MTTSIVQLCTNLCGTPGTSLPKVKKQHLKATTSLSGKRNKYFPLLHVFATAKQPLNVDSKCTFLMLSRSRYQYSRFVDRQYVDTLNISGQNLVHFYGSSEQFSKKIFLCNECNKIEILSNFLKKRKVGLILCLDYLNR